MEPSRNDKVLFVDFEKCTGCRTCEVACSLRNEGICNPAMSRITVINWEEVGVDVPTVCQQCENPLCKAVCPMEAVYRHPESGILAVDPDLCIGCRSCMMACPFGALVVHPRTGKVTRCTLCDGDPTCVKYCESGALQYVSASKLLYLKKKASAARLSELLEKIQID